MSHQSRRGSSGIDPEKVIPTYSIPWIHRDAWNDKEWFYAIEGIFIYMFICIINLLIIRLVGYLCNSNENM